jgi:NADP-reducing hydrogenase subunit HndD
MSNETITLTIDGQKISVPKGTTIMDAAETIGIHIPRLCYHPDLSLAGSCRVCIVDVKDMGFHMASCSVAAWEGMEVKTNSPEIRQARRDIVELLLDNHPKECQTCERDGNCELQDLAYSLGVRERLFEGERKDPEPDKSSVAVIRDPHKCVLCGRCVRVCDEVQGVCNLSQQGRGFHTHVSPAHEAKMDDSVCIQCGQCINVCPTAAILESNSTDDVWAALADPTKHVVVQTAPSIRAAIGEGFGLPVGTPETGRLVTALRRLGFDAVFNTNFTADLTILEEATEFIHRIQNGGQLPLITSCSPGWINFMEKFYPDLIPNASSCQSPMTMMSSLLKTYYAEQKGMDPKDIYVVAVMPCTAKKYEAKRDDHFIGDMPKTDAVLTTRELIWMVKCYGIDYVNLPDDDFDTPLGMATGAADIFGTTGGVMEAALRTAVEWVTKKPVGKLEFTEVRAVEGLKEASFDLEGTTINVAVSNGITNAKTVLDKILAGEKQYHLVEIMACPGGCIGGGGQPYPPEGMYVLDHELVAKRREAIYSLDSHNVIRRSHKNPALMKLYNDYLGEPGSHKCHELLHTSYSAKLPRGIR